MFWLLTGAALLLADGWVKAEQDGDWWPIDDPNDDGGNGTAPLPPGSGPTQRFDGPWFSTQLVLSLSIGVTSFLVFCFLRTRWEVVYMGRTKLKDFSPTPAHDPDSQKQSSTSRFLGWILPTLRTSEYTVLQTVGLDAAVLLNFFRMGFSLFGVSALLALLVLIPLNLFRNGSTDSGSDPSGNFSLHGRVFPQWPNQMLNATTPERKNSLYDLLLDPTTSSTIHLIFAYLFTFLSISFFHRNFHRFVLARQAFGLQLIHSVSARTVLVANLPSHLRGDRTLAEYFESCNWPVESVSVCRGVQVLDRVLDRRTNALLKLEQAWVEWVGNPAKNDQGYDPHLYSGKSTPQVQDEAAGVSEEHLVDLGNDTASLLSTAPQTYGATTSIHSSTHDNEAHPHSHVHIHTTRPRPTLRPRWFGAKVDAIEHWEKKYRAADEEVKELRKKGRFGATHAAFVTFEDARDAQIACQVVHYPQHSQVITTPAPEPRDVIWSHIAMSPRESEIRDFVIMSVMAVLLLTWIVPVSTLATLLSYQEIKKVMPWLAKVIDASPRLATIVQNSLPLLALLTFNGCLPFLFEWLSYMQAFKSRSATEYSLMKKYHLFLVVSVLFIFLLTSTYWALVRDLVDTPMKIPEKLARALQGSNVRNFMVSYVMLQALGLMPLQLLNLGPLFSLGFARAFSTRTPRDYAEANAPPMLNYGWVYPQALLVFTITLVFSVMSPLILVFGATYFAVGSVRAKNILLMASEVYFKPYESNGEAWRITFARTLWALIIFQLFMTGLFSLRLYYYASIAMLPLISYTLWKSWVMWRDFGPLSKHLAASSVCEVQRGEDVDGVLGVLGEGSISRSQSMINHRRYAVNDETLYVAPSDSRTDYSQPPMNNFYNGVLNTGRRRYAHPALSGSLPTPWLPAISDKHVQDNGRGTKGVVLSLRRKVVKRLRGDRWGAGEGRESESASLDASRQTLVPESWTQGADVNDHNSSHPAQTDSMPSYSTSSLPANPWGDPSPSPSALQPKNRTNPLKKRKSGEIESIIALPEGSNVWEDDEQGDEPESPSTYYHASTRRTLSSGESGNAKQKSSVPKTGGPW
nr:membrane protein [Cryptococcus depauperatus CBS 7855]